LAEFFWKTKRIRKAGGGVGVCDQYLPVLVSVGLGQ
jgi:hypothetical protein